MGISQNFKKLFEKPRLENLPLDKLIHSCSTSDISCYQSFEGKAKNSFLVTGTTSFTKLGAIEKAYDVLEEHIANFYSFNDGLNACVEDFVKSSLCQSMSRKEDEQIPLKAFVLNDGNTLVLNQNGWHMRLEKDGDVIRGIQGPEAYLNEVIYSTEALAELVTKDYYLPVMQSFMAFPDRNMKVRVTRDVVEGAKTVENGITRLETKSLIYNEVYCENGDFIKQLEQVENEVIATNSCEDLIPSPITKLEKVVTKLEKVFSTQPEELMFTEMQQAESTEYNE